MLDGKLGPHRRARTALVAWALIGAVAGAPLACDNASEPVTTIGSCDIPGGPVPGPADAHCSAFTSVDPAACHAGASGGGGSGGAGAGGGPAAGAGGAATGGASAATPLFNLEGDDSDCKYHVGFTSTALCRDVDVMFTLTAMINATGLWLCGAAPTVDATLGDGHHALVAGQHTTETSMGHYDVGPIRFDAPGRWTVRFVFNPSCAPSASSPRSEIAFFVDVP